MTPKQYMKAASRTMPTKDDYAFDGLNGLTPEIEHAIIGITSEAGELTDIIKKVKMYHQQLDKVNLIEEAGDIMWYLAVLSKATGVSFEEIWKKNIDKLKIRWPEKYNDYEALEENRDRGKERKVLEG